jgi:hypothetical protein
MALWAMSNPSTARPEEFSVAATNINFASDWLKVIRPDAGTMPAQMVLN